MDPLALAALIGGTVTNLAGAADPYFYTDQEQAADKVKRDAIAASVAGSQAAVQINHDKVSSQETVVKYGLMGVLGLGVLGIAYGLVRQ